MSLAVASLVSDNFSSEENTWPVVTQFHLEPPGFGGKKVCSNRPSPKVI